jgi:hypothetical protein
MPGSRVAFCARRPREPGTQYDRFELRGVRWPRVAMPTDGSHLSMNRNAAATIEETEDAAM